MKAELKDGNLVVTLPFSEIGAPSATGKTKNHASTRGNKPSGIMVGDKELIVGVNAYTK